MLGGLLFRYDELTITASGTQLPYEEYMGVFLLALRKQQDDRTYSVAILLKAKSEYKVVTLDGAAITNYIDIHTAGSVVMSFSSKDSSINYVIRIRRIIS